MVADLGMTVKVNATNDNGAYMGLAGLIGVIAGRAYSQSDLDKAKDAQKDWKRLTDWLDKTGEGLAESGSSLAPSADQLLKQLCSFSVAGYVPDYRGILNRAVAAGTLQFDRQILEAKRQQHRYALGVNANVEVELRIAQASAVVGAYATAAEAAREFMWKESFSLLTDGAKTLEQAYVGRVQAGAEIASWSSKGYAELVTQWRLIAKENVGEFSELMEIIATLIPVWFGPQWTQNLMTTIGSIL